MRNQIVLALLGCLALAGMPASAAERWLATQLVEVSIAPDGRVTDASLPRTELGPDVQAEILRRVRQFEFEPATVNGVPATTETTLAVKLAVVEVDDRLAVTVDGANITIGMAQLKGPRFPRSQMSRIGEARIELKVEYDADGAVTGVSVVSARPDLKVFRNATLEAAREWRLTPERVNGQGQAGVAFIPVTFERSAHKFAVVSFPDGGKLRVTREVERKEELLSSQVRLRSTGDATPASPTG